MYRTLRLPNDKQCDMIGYRYSINKVMNYNEGHCRICSSHELAEHSVHRSDDVVAVLFGNHHRGLVLYDIAMDTIGQYDDLVVQQHPIIDGQ